MPELVYGSTFEKGTFSLIELNSPELVEAFEAGTNIVIKGLPEDEAVLCTDTKTYNVRQVSTSNTMLLTLPVSTQGVMTVLDELSSTIELLPCVPGLQRIDTLLEETRYAGEQQEAHLSDKAFYSYEALLSLVQASEAELKRGLEERGAFELKGYYRLLDQAHLHHLFDTFVNHCVLRELNVRAMTLKEAQECIRHVMSLEDDYCTGIPEEVELAFLRSFTTDASFSSYQDGVSFDETRVCRFLGNLLLKSERGKEWLHSDLMEIWRNLTPAVFIPKLSMLKGLCVCNERVAVHSTQLYVSYFPRDELPTNPAQRFTALFSQKKLWSGEEIKPFLEDLAPETKKQESLLLKFTRLQRTKDKLLYGSRIK